MSADLRGRLLVATLNLEDPNFRRTVVLMLAHADEGALGVVLNRPSVTPVGHLLADWEDLASYPDVVFLGGPVNLENVIGLADFGPQSVDSLRRSIGDADPVVGGVEPVDLNGSPADLDRPASDLRLFAGSAGWGPGQLEAEIATGSWWVLPALSTDVFTDDPERLWSHVLRRQPGRLAWFASGLGDPNMN